MFRYVVLAAIALCLPVSASAQSWKNIPLPTRQNATNADLPISGAVWANDTLYISGWLDPDRRTNKDTQSQTVQVVLPATASSGALIEVDMIAVRPK